MSPGDIYLLAVVITSLFVAPFNALARVIVLSWIVAHIGWLLGLPEQWANLAGQLCVLIIGSRHMRTTPSLLAWALSIPLIMVNCAWLVQITNPVTAWWTVLILAMCQLLILPFAINGETLRAVSRAWHDSADGGLFRVRAV